jgi:hypothetical protein
MEKLNSELQEISDRIISVLKNKTYGHAKAILEHCLLRIQYESTLN